MSRPAAVILAEIANEHARLSLASTGDLAFFYRKAARAYRRASKDEARQMLPATARLVSSTPVPGCTYEGDF